MLSYIRYFGYIWMHKYRVARECIKRGLYVRAITHDLSKFSRAEFSPYARKFFGGEPRCPAFGGAWQHHQDHNDHHWQWWVNPETGEPARMSDDACVEMCCDWIAMAKGDRGAAMEWFRKNEGTMKLHPDTRQRALEVIAYLPEWC